MVLSFLKACLDEDSWLDIPRLHSQSRWVPPASGSLDQTLAAASPHPSSCMVQPARIPHSTSASLQGCAQGYQSDSDMESTAGFCLIINQVFHKIPLYHKVKRAASLGGGTEGWIPPGAAPSWPSQRSIPTICRDTREQLLVCLTILLLLLAGAAQLTQPRPRLPPPHPIITLVQSRCRT